MRLDKQLLALGLVGTRSQAESYIRMGKVLVNGTVRTKPGFTISKQVTVKLKVDEQYVSRAGQSLLRCKN